jgi:hypothetical protein
VPKFEGPYPGRKVNGIKGVMRLDRKRKREEAEARNKAYRKKLIPLTASPTALEELENEQFEVKMPHLEAPYRVA